MLGLLQNLRGVGALLELCVYVHTQELEPGQPFHTLPTDADGLQLGLPPSDVDYQLFHL